MRDRTDKWSKIRKVSAAESFRSRLQPGRGQARVRKVGKSLRQGSIISWIFDAAGGTGMLAFRTAPPRETASILAPISTLESAGSTEALPVS
jgi:hypothetical protein